MKCNFCEESHPEDMLNHVRLIHPEALDAAITESALGLKPVDYPIAGSVCDSCDKPFKLGKMYGEKFEDMFNGLPIVSLVCSECFWKVG